VTTSLRQRPFFFQAAFGLEHLHEGAGVDDDGFGPVGPVGDAQA